MIRSTYFDSQYLLVDKQRCIVCIACDLEKIDKFLRGRNASEFTIISKHFSVDKWGMTVKEFDSQGNILDEKFLSYSDYGDAIWDVLFV